MQGIVTWCRRIGRALFAAGLTAIAVVPLAPDVGAQSSQEPLAFVGSASADGVRMKVDIPGFPATNTPLDAGGPTAQAAVDSLGTSTAYAAFPDPGELVLTAPGLVVGLFAGGTGGLPPIDLPTLPDYPFFVSSSMPTKPEAAAGSGPYRLSANSKARSSEALASGGFSTGAAGNAALVSSTATVTENAGQVEAKAVSDFQGLTVGPLTIAGVTSTARMTMDAGGATTPSSSTQIAGVRIAGIAVALTPEGFDLGGSVIPIPIEETLASILEESGVTVKLLPEQRFPDRVIAPAVVITYPFELPEIPNVGRFEGIATIVLGSATARLSAGGTAADPLPLADAVLPDPTMPSTGADFAPSLDSLPAPSLTPASPNPPTAPGDAGQGQTIADIEIPQMTLDVRSVYLLIFAGAATVTGLGQLIRRLGERAWTSTSG